MTDTFIHEIALKTTPSDERVLEVRLEAGRNLYNACLRESLRRLDLMRESKAFQAARKIPKGKLRIMAFKACRDKQGFMEYALHPFAARICKSCWIGDHLDAFTIQKIASRAFHATEQHAYGGRGRPRYKRKGWFTSVEGKSNTGGIRWRNRRVLWSGLSLAPIFDSKDKHWVEAHALSCRVKYLRLLKRTIREETRWSVQLVLEGMPHQKTKNIIADSVCGLEIGATTIAAVSEDATLLARFCDEVVQTWSGIRREHRAQNRSCRATNPDNYNDDGSLIKSSHTWYRSNRYKKRQKRIAEFQRVFAATRKKQHNEMCNKVLSLGKIIKLQKLSNSAFQNYFGRRAMVRGHGLFIDQLTRKAANAGGTVEDISVGRTKLSRTCICGTVGKKPPRQPQQGSSCGAVVDRNLISAFLAKYCVGQTLDIRRAKAAWPAAEPLLRRAMSGNTETTSRGLPPASFGISRRQSCSPVENGSTAIKVVDAVARKGESHKEMVGSAVGSPWPRPEGGSEGDVYENSDSILSQF